MTDVSRAVLAALLLFPVLAFPSAVFSAQSKSDQSRWPNEREKGTYQAKIASTGKVLWRVQWETTVKKERDRSQVEIQEQGEGRPWRAKESVVWKKRILFEEGSAQPSSGSGKPAMQVQSVVGSKWSRDGRPMGEMDFQVDPGLGRIFYKDSEMGRRPQSAVLPLTPQSIPDELLFHWARMLPFQQEEGGKPPSTECTLVVSPSRQFRIKAQVQGTEMVTTPAGTFFCYRVSLVPQLPGPLKALAPRMSLWCRTESPNYWVRYQGPVGGPGSPEAVIELVKFEQGSS